MSPGPYEEIHEPIEVIAYFADGQLYPKRFRWQHRVYRAKKIESSWAIQEGLGRVYHFSISTGEKGSFELTYDTQDMNWELARMYRGG